MKSNKEYIKFLEDKLAEYEGAKYLDKNIELNSLLKMQNEFTTNKINEYESLLTENKRLAEENAKLSNIVLMNNLYINYINHSIWWKISNPIRKCWLYLKNINSKKINYLNKNYNITHITNKVSVIIMAYNNNPELANQINNINNQKNVDNIEIIVITRNDNKSKDTDNIKYINLDDTSLTNDEIYIKVLPYINGDYVTIIDQNKIIEKDDWLYKSLLPVINNEALATLFLENDLSELKKNTYYQALKNRLYTIDNNNVLLLPMNRNIVDNIDINLLKNPSVIVKKKISNYYLI